MRSTLFLTLVVALLVIALTSSPVDGAGQKSSRSKSSRSGPTKAGNSKAKGKSKGHDGKRSGGKQGKQGKQGKRRKEPPVPQCKPFGEFTYPQGPPAKQYGITFCQQFKESTCCNKTHTNTILRKAYPYFTEDVSADCVQVASTVLCAPCDPEVGTGLKPTICPDLCARWYTACLADLYTFDKITQNLVPCTFDSLVCAPLYKIVDSGASFCERSGLAVYKSPSRTDREQFVDLLTGNKPKPGICYDGKVPTPFAKAKAQSQAHAERKSRRRKTKLPWYQRTDWIWTSLQVMGAGVVVLTALGVAYTLLRRALAPRQAPVAARMLEARLKRFNAESEGVESSQDADETAQTTHSHTE